MLPLGGFVSMAGENDESDDPNSFDKKPAWQRLIVSLAGPVTNLLVGLIMMVILTLFINLGDTTVSRFYDRDEGIVSSESSGLRVGDEVIKVNGKRVKFAEELSYEIIRNGHLPCDITVIRDGREIELSDVVFPTQSSSGQVFGIMDFGVYRIEKNFFNSIEYSFSKTVLTVRMCVEGIVDLIRGRFSFEGVSGPVGISKAIGEAARTDHLTLINLIGFISINLGIMNLLPIPALDGGRSLVLCVEMITKKRIPPKVENIINAVALALLLGLSVLVMVKDVLQIVAH
jgi:regulator of sigma E protease